MTALAETGFDLVLCGMILAAAASALGMRDRFGAVVFFIVYGVFIALGWLRLDAVDVALAEVALGAGLSGVLLLRANARLPASARIAAGPAVRIVPVGVAAAVTLMLGWAFLTLPEPAGLQGAVAANLYASGAENPVTAVLLNFRGWDTLLESVVLLAALIGVWSVATNDAWGRRPGLTQHALPGGVLVSFGRLLPPVGLMIGVYLVWVGSSRPGGAFQGGTVLAAVALLVMMGGLMRPPPVVSRRLRLALVAGPAVFLAVGLVGAVAGTFLGLRPDIAKPLILGIEAALTLSIATTLALVVVGPPEQPEERT
ncbi:hydrogenase subunit MbhD domain-containing protein [Aurantimonas aggregata]